MVSLLNNVQMKQLPSILIINTSEWHIDSSLLSNNRCKAGPNQCFRDHIAAPWHLARFASRSQLESGGCESSNAMGSPSTRHDEPQSPVEGCISSSPAWLKKFSISTP
ncbi:hypothetical protein VaNZ11_012453 [Volvox africanus]|uniref:Uncharacterized protein n=1 Tax=Volvox africanus TaxID=51714 RepID=A0ABQ5SFF9_9CHLO|nr:hypothetical protein VaNZ11_012453 [Volvox africanus]